MASAAQTKAAALEGLDFIETEEDVKAVEAATLKIQSTFRGKKIRSKVGGGGGAGTRAAPAQPESAASSKVAPASSSATSTTNPKQQQQQQQASQSSSKEQVESELSKKVGAMQVQDNTTGDQQAAGKASMAAGEDEAERAATKIQAGFKGYKTRKELEGKLPAGAPGADEKGAVGAPS